MRPKQQLINTPIPAHKALLLRREEKEPSQNRRVRIRADAIRGLGARLPALGEDEIQRTGYSDQLGE
jgi:hypothetical protein